MADDLQGIRLFDDAGIDAYSRRKLEKMLYEALAAKGLELSDVIALSEPFEFVLITRHGIVEVHERGGFRKRTEVGDLLSWDHIKAVTQTQPGMTVFGIELRGEGDILLRSYKWSAGGSREDSAERNRVYAIMAREARG